MRTTAWLCSCALSVGVQGCIYLPIAHTEAATPPLLGQHHRADGSAASGERIALSLDSRDMSCERPFAFTTTDSSGGFSFAATTVRRRGYLIFPPIEHFWTLYSACAGTSDSTLHHVYEGHGSLRQEAPPDMIACQDFVVNDRTRTTCSTASDHAIVEGGRWTDGDATGWFRLILTEEMRRPPGYRRDVPRPAAYVQWIEDTANPRTPHRVRAIAELPIEFNVSGVQRIELVRRYDRWWAEFPGTRKEFMNDFASMRLAFELGRPGHVGDATPQR